jgi:hypothetical protein
MSSLKKLSKSDVTVVPYYANKQWSFTRSTSTTYSSLYKGTNITGAFSITSDPKTAGQYERLIYNSINHLFYQSYTGSLNTSSLANSLNNYESASQQRPTSSYFIYNDNNNLVNNYPTGTNQNIQVLAINQNIYGNKVLPNSVLLTGATVNVTDDGFGNLYDTYSTKTHIGNLFYAHGMVIITNQSYQNLFTNTFTLNFKNEYIIYENEVRCLIKESDYNLTYNPTIVSGSYASGSIKDFATGSNFQPYVTSIGLYNDNDELLAVAKFGKPIIVSPNTDMTFVVKYDT